MTNHGIWLLQKKDIKKPVYLAERLSSGDDPFSAFLFEQMPETLRNNLQRVNGSIDEPIHTALTDELNRLITGHFLYEANRCAHIRYRNAVEQEEIENMWQRKEENLVRLNRLLLQNAYPEVIGGVTGVGRLRVALGWRLKKYDKHFRIFTAFARIKPSFLIIGAQKAGTTSFYNYLIAHPQVYPTTRKEVHFYDIRWEKGMNFYRSYFPSQLIRLRTPFQPVMSGEATPEYLFYPEAQRRIARTLPDIKMIVLLRNPIDRAYSHYVHNVKAAGDREPLTFEQAIQQEEDRIFQGQPPQHEIPVSTESIRYSYLSRGRYVEQLKHLFSLFPRENILILSSETMFKDPDTAYQQALCFIGLPEYHLDDYRNVFGSGTREAYINAEREAAKMLPETRAQLVEYYRPYNAQLYDLIGMTFDWDK